MCEFKYSLTRTIFIEHSYRAGSQPALECVCVCVCSYHQAQMLYDMKLFV